MQSAVKIENWNGNDIRFVWVEDKCEWWAVLSDIATAPELQTAAVTRRLEQYMTSSHTLNDANGRPHDYIIVNEMGMYDAIFSSRRNEAKEFKQWVYGILKVLSRSTGIEGFQIFRMLDKEHQKEMMAKLQSGMKQVDKGRFIKANMVTNKTVANMYGLSKAINKAKMSPEQLQIREAILADTVEIMSMKDKYDLNLSVSKTIYDKYKLQSV